MVRMDPVYANLLWQSSEDAGSVHAPQDHTSCPQSTCWVENTAPLDHSLIFENGSCLP